MKRICTLRPEPTADPSQVVFPLETRLTREQFEALNRCASGISLRFDAHEIVNALVARGYAEKGVAGVIAVTTEGHKYLRKHAAESRA